MQRMQRVVIGPAANWWSIKMIYEYISVSNCYSANVTYGCARTTSSLMAIWRLRAATESDRNLMALSREPIWVAELGLVRRRH